MSEIECRRKKWALLHMRISYILILLFQYNGKIIYKIVSDWLLEKVKRALISCHMQNKITCKIKI